LQLTIACCATKQNKTKTGIMFKTTLFAALALGASANLSASSPEEIKVMWENFKETHSKVYGTMTEELSRFQKFTENLAIIDKRNAIERAAGGSAKHGITQFSDMTQQEFADIFLTLDVTKIPSSNNTVSDVKPYTGPAGLVDWTGRYTTAVKNQGYCGSCWAFSASEQIESDAIRQAGWSTGTWLSPEQLVDCDTRSSACNGGWPEWAYDYVKRAGGIELESDYPYSAYYGNSGSCKANSGLFKVGVSGYSTFAQGAESQMASYVKSTGPVSIALDASDWNSYTGGVVTSCGKSVNHAVQAVGVDDSSNGYWKVRNSWGASWGEAGYIRLKYGQNTCNVAYRASYTNTYRK
jgi:C1A family cysteine protease